MTQKGSYALILSAMMLAACGGSGGGAAPSLVRTSITGTTSPPPAPASGPVSASANVLMPPNSSGTWPSIVQAANYVFDPAARPAFTTVSSNILPVDTQTGTTTINIGPAQPADPTLGQFLSIQQYVAGVMVYQAMSAAALQNAGLNLAQSVRTGWKTAPYSPTLNPSGYSYQTFGAWQSTDNAATGAFTEHYFSAGAPALGTALPKTGTASYTGFADGSFVDAATRDFAYTSALLNATADFATSSIAFKTTATLSRSTNAATGTPWTAAPGLDMSGTLSYATGSNTFTGTVTAANGMSGNATGRFYGPGTAAATTTKVAGAPPEIGGTFAVMGTAGTMQGAFGGK